MNFNQMNTSMYLQWFIGYVHIKSMIRDNPIHISCNVLYFYISLIYYAKFQPQSYANAIGSYHMPEFSNREGGKRTFDYFVGAIIS